MTLDQYESHISYHQNNQKYFVPHETKPQSGGTDGYYIFPSKRCPLIKFQYSAICLLREKWNSILTAFFSSLLWKLWFYLLGVLQYQFEGMLAHTAILNRAMVRITIQIIGWFSGLVMQCLYDADKIRNSSHVGPMQATCCSLVDKRDF